MSKMMIRGGDLDLVEYEFSPFCIGENIKTLGIDKRNFALKSDRNPVEVKVPARIHLSVLDMNRFAPERPGGGGLGFAISVYTTAVVECTDEKTEIDFSRKPIIKHFVEVFKKVTGYSGGFKICIRYHEKKHIGLGSTGSVMLAAGHAMNRAVGNPLTSEEIRLLIGCNYVEETTDGRIIRGFETGVGPAAATYGGMAVMGDDLTLVYHSVFAENENVYIIMPPTSADSAGEEEFRLLMNRARVLDYRDRELKAYMILMDLIPALKKKDLKKIGDIMWEIDFRGSKRAEVEHNSFEIYHYMSRLKETGLEFVGMSSVGPSIAVITKKGRCEVEKIAKDIGLEIALETKTDNVGIRFIENSPDKAT
ncbi:beta-RFAP synthase [Methanomicrobium sp. W14]|uniref:GHMP family kinase ATP-binding protein n=1 Tax=Methanomicrobium sp. W14 TaxID=2817839 RepID=UPI001AE36F0F|nr:GHMP kinase [Methanomicrobium sp. W14]MBP2133866.1 beta-RFAP synthase [Methanomicrobium sp. W14]